ncbi:MAG TPA: hypothetical protein VGM54_02190 [Chthoniobacter sp.]|jgi:pimeloyl-ACP methyl ester carboxylesterase
MSLPLIILHGWSDNSSSFTSLAAWLKGNGFNVIEIYLGDYLSMNDEITLYDLGSAFRRALERNNIPQGRYSFDLVVHSTGGLVALEYLRQVCQGDATKTPIQHLCMLAPANLGSSLAKLGKSVIGRLFKGWSWDHFAQSGQRILDALELASPYSWQLIEDNLFDSGFRVLAPENTITTVMVGTTAYPDALRSSIHENGSDGTVRVSTANLNCHYYEVDFSNPNIPVIRQRQGNYGPVALAVFHRNHTSIHDPAEPTQHDLWARTITDALRTDAAGYDAHFQRCQVIADTTFREGVAGAHPDWYHQYQHVVFRVHDQFGQPIRDYIVEFYQERGDDKDKVFETIHKEILDKVTTNEVDGSYRSFLFDTTDLNAYLDQNPSAEIQMSVSAANLSPRITFRNPNGGVNVFSPSERTLIFPNQPVLIDITLYRDATIEDPNPANVVFKLTMAK